MRVQSRARGNFRAFLIRVNFTQKAIISVYNILEDRHKTTFMAVASKAHE